jgi:hypothetical protein
MDLPGMVWMRRFFFFWKRVLAPARIEYLLVASIKKKPPATGSQGANFFA